MTELEALKILKDNYDKLWRNHRLAVQYFESLVAKAPINNLVGFRGVKDMFLLCRNDYPETPELAEASDVAHAAMCKYVSKPVHQKALKRHDKEVESEAEDGQDDE